MTVFLTLGAFCLGIVLEHRDTRKKRNGWREYRPSTNPLRDYK